MLNTRTILVWSFTISALFLNACGESETKEATPKPTSDQPKEQPDTASIDMDALPSPIRIAYLFYEANLEFLPDLIIEPTLYDGLTQSTDKMLLFGMYGSDLAYCAFNNREEESLSRFELMDRISEDIGFNLNRDQETILKRFENNVNDIDSVIHILSRYQMDIDNYIEQNNDQDKALLMFSSAWIETMYLGCSVKDLELNEDLLEILIYQSDICDILVRSLDNLSEYQNDPTVKLLVSDIQNIQQGFQAIGLPEGNEEEFTIKRVNLHKLVDRIFEARKNLLNRSAA